MMRSITASAPFSVVLVMDPVTGGPPETMGGESLAVGASSVAVGTLAEADGATTFFLGDAVDAPPADALVLRWAGSLPTPSGRLGIVAVDDVVLVDVESEASGRTHLQIWTNDDSEPDVIWVALGEGGHVSDRSAAEE
jgi:hypothetical protein